LAGLLSQGVSLPDALDQVPGLLPRHAAAMVRIGCQSGALAPALRQAASIHSLQDPVCLSLIGKIGYFCVMTIFGLLVSGFLAWKILPQFARIFADFGAPLPEMTQAVSAAMRWCVAWWYLPTLLVLAVFWYAVARYLGWIYWDLPGLRRLARRHDTAVILDGLAVAAAQSRPMLEGLNSLARSYPKRAVRRRLRRAAAEVEAGDDWCQALCRQGLIGQADRAVLAAAQRVGNLAWALGEMADSNRRRLVYHAQALVQMLFPPVLLVFGLIVMFVVIGVFLPLVALIYRLS
jgi:type II secretory pathway component PulF